MSNHNKNKFNFFIPATFEKGKKDGKEVVRVKGIASTSTTEDSDGETLFPDGFDYTPLLEKGFLNWDHQQKTRPSAIIGQPDVAKIINGGKDFYIEGYLYSNSKEAQECAELAAVLEANSPDRRLGYSIEGQVIERDAMNPKKVLRARITGIAITPCPKNPNTLLSLMKGEYSEAFVEDEETKTCPKCDHDQMIKGKCLNCNYIEETKKAMTAEGASEEGLIPEHVEGFKNPNKYPLDEDKEEHRVAGSIKKSEVYNLIAKTYTTDLVKAKQIFNFIKSVNKKFFSMENTISQEAITKAFDFLNKASENEVTDKEGNVVETGLKKADSEETTNDDANDMEKAKEMCKGLIKAGKSKSECADEMVKSGISLEVAQTAVASVVSEMSNLKENGGNITEVTAATVTGANQALNKSESNVVGELLSTTGPDVEKLFTDTFGKTNDLIKGLSDSFENKFSAVGQILKAQFEQNNIMKGQLDTLSADNKTLTERLGNIENEAVPTKSAKNVKHLERFAKSDTDTSHPTGTNVYNLNSREDRTDLLNVLDAEIMKSRNEGRTPSEMLVKAVAELEIVKTIPAEVLPLLRSMHIAVERK